MFIPRHVIDTLFEPTFLEINNALRRGDGVQHIPGRAYRCSLLYARPGFLDFSGRSVEGGGGVDHAHIATLEHFERQLRGSDEAWWDERGSFTAAGYAGTAPW